MEEKDFNKEDINSLINSALSKEEKTDYSELRNLFEQKLLSLNISPNQAVENIQIEYRTLYGILDGSLKRFDMLSLLKIAQFLERPSAEIVGLYTKSIADKHKDDLSRSRRRTFILNNFDLPVLRTMGVIDSIRDFEHIEKRLNSIFELNAITDYNVEEVGAAFSAGKIKPKNLQTRKYFIKKAEFIFKSINNPHLYEKPALVDYFPKIRWHSTDVENGLINVMRSLYELGVTVVFQPKTPLLQIRGATFAVNGKPCIVLTDYKGFYPTLWFALIHELFHVLFDWEEILQKKYHLSDEGNDLFVVKHKEDEANDFAREFLFPRKKMELISDKIQQRIFIREFAFENHVHPSIVYANYAFDNSNHEENYWASFQRFMPPIKDLLRKVGNDLGQKAKVSEYANYYKNIIFNAEENDK